ncbi:hypothetical protein SDC9_121582 [bioreactor metagenome]|uniref:Uncharacterized protein n=1 Tax=bioreactor metagenome TaxID=1076179 RepID=A0A645CCD9_9ZZZZ
MFSLFTLGLDLLWRLAALDFLSLVAAGAFAIGVAHLAGHRVGAADDLRLRASRHHGKQAERQQ